MGQPPCQGDATHSPVWFLHYSTKPDFRMSTYCGPQNYRVLLLTSDDVRRCSSTLTSSRSKTSGSNSLPIHSSISSCSGCSGSWMASRNLAYPQTPPQSSGGQARLPVRQTG